MVKKATNEPVIIDVRVDSIGDVPPKYFMHDEVIAALERVIRSDVVVHGQPVPPGVRPIMGANSLANATYKLNLATSDLGKQVKKSIPALVIFYLMLVGVVAAAYAIWRILHG